MIKGYPVESIYAYIELLNAVVGKTNTTMLTKRMLEIQYGDEATRVYYLETIETILDISKKYNYHNIIIDPIYQQILNASYSKDWRVRVHAICALVWMLESRYREAIWFRLSEVIDNDIFEIKVALLSRLKVSDVKSDKLDYIFEKAQSDTNYWVRKIARDYTDNDEENEK